MKSSTLKKILLAALVVVAGYVWWGNLTQFYGGQTYESYDSGRESTTNNVDNKRAQLAYKPPKINPFRRFPSQNKVAPPTNTRRRSEPPPVPVPALSTQYTLSGILSKQDRPQAVVRCPGNISTVVTVGDSLGNWEVIVVSERSLICQQGKTHDTLWHGGQDTQ